MMVHDWLSMQSYDASAVHSEYSMPVIQSCPCGAVRVADLVCFELGWKEFEKGDTSYHLKFVDKSEEAIKTDTITEYTSNEDLPCPCPSCSPVSGNIVSHDGADETPKKPSPPDDMLPPNRYCYAGSDHFIDVGSEEDKREQAKSRLRFWLEEILRCFGYDVLAKRK